MKYKILFSENAKKDLINIVRYISDELSEPELAAKLSQRILKAVTSLDEFPCGIDYVIMKSGETKVLEFFPLKIILFFIFRMKSLIS